MSEVIAMTIVLGLTGGIATGKSTADQYFRRKGIPVIDADQISHDIIDIGKPAWEKIRAHFGPKFLNEDQSINRRKLGQFVFQNANELKVLNDITHPLIHEEIIQQIAVAKQKGVDLIVLDAPVLFETNGDLDCDQTLVISLPPQLQLERLIERNHYSIEEAKARIASQMPLRDKEARATYVIENTGTIKELEEKLTKVLNKIKVEG